MQSYTPLLNWSCDLEEGGAHLEDPEEGNRALKSLAGLLFSLKGGFSHEEETADVHNLIFTLYENVPRLLEMKRQPKLVERVHSMGSELAVSSSCTSAMGQLGGGARTIFLKVGKRLFQMARSHVDADAGGQAEAAAPKMDRETGAMLHKLADDCFIHALAALSPQSLEQPPCGAPSGAPSPQHLCQLADTLTTRARCILSLCQLQDLPYGQDSTAVLIVTNSAAKALDTAKGLAARRACAMSGEPSMARVVQLLHDIASCYWEWHSWMSRSPAEVEGSRRLTAGRSYQRQSCLHRAIEALNTVFQVARRADAQPRGFDADVVQRSTGIDLRLWLMLLTRLVNFCIKHKVPSQAVSILKTSVHAAEGMLPTAQERFTVKLLDLELKAACGSLPGVKDSLLGIIHCDESTAGHVVEAVKHAIGHVDNSLEEQNVSWLAELQPLLQTCLQRFAGDNSLLLTGILKPLLAQGLRPATRPIASAVAVELLADVDFSKLDRAQPPGGNPDIMAAAQKLFSTALWCTVDPYQRARAARLLAWLHMRREDWAAALECIQIAQSVQQPPSVETAIYKLQILVLKGDCKAAIAAAHALVTTPGCEFETLSLVVNEAVKHGLPTVAAAALEAYHELAAKCAVTYTAGQASQVFKTLVAVRLGSVGATAPESANAADAAVVETLRAASEYLAEVGAGSFFGLDTGDAAWFAAEAFSVGRRRLQAGHMLDGSRALRVCMQFHDLLGSCATPLQWDVQQMQAIRLAAAYAAITGKDPAGVTHASRLLAQVKRTASKEGWLGQADGKAADQPSCHALLLGALALRVLIVDRQADSKDSAEAQDRRALLLSKALSALQLFSKDPVGACTGYAAWLQTPELMAASVTAAMGECSVNGLPKVASSLNQALSLIDPGTATHAELLRQAVGWLQAGQWGESYPAEEACWLAVRIWRSGCSMLASARDCQEQDIPAALELSASLLDRANPGAPKATRTARQTRMVRLAHRLCDLHTPDRRLDAPRDGEACAQERHQAAADSATPAP
eukprot:jgi/Tetstr1/457440/TSEL_044025.t1